MTILETEDIDYRRFNGYADARLPEGYWFGAGTVTGDATGGTAVISLHFSPAAPAVSSRIFNLEQLSMFSSDIINLPVRFEIFNLGGPQNQDMRGFYAMEISASVDASAVLGRDSAMLPLFLGAQQVASQVSQIAMTAPNANLETFTLEAQGYWWGPRSILADGGPQRPPSGLYRA